MQELEYSVANSGSEAEVQKRKNNREDFSNQEWDFDFGRFQLATKFLHDVIEYSQPDFYGFRGEVNDTDLVMYVDIADLGTDFGNLKTTLSKYLDKARSVSFIPNNGYVTMCVAFKDVFPKI